MKKILSFLSIVAIAFAWLLTWDTVTPPVQASNQINVGSFHHSFPSKTTTYKFKHPQVINGHRWIGVTAVPRSAMKKYVIARRHGHAVKYTTYYNVGTGHMKSCSGTASPQSHNCDNTSGGWYITITFQATSVEIGSTWYVDTGPNYATEVNAADNGSGLYSQVSTYSCAAPNDKSTNEENCHYNFQIKDISQSNSWCGVAGNVGSCNGSFDNSSYEDIQWDNGGSNGIYVLWGSDLQYCSSIGPIDQGCVVSTTVSQP